MVSGRLVPGARFTRFLGIAKMLERLPGPVEAAAYGADGNIQCGGPISVGALGFKDRLVQGRKLPDKVRISVTESETGEGPRSLAVGPGLFGFCVCVHGRTKGVAAPPT